MKDSELKEQLEELDPNLIDAENKAGHYKRLAWNMIVQRKKLTKGVDLSELSNYKPGDIVTHGKFNYQISYPYRFKPDGVVYKARKVMMNGELTKEQNLFLQGDKSHENEQSLSKAQKLFKQIADSHEVSYPSLASEIGANMTQAVYATGKTAMHDKLAILTLLSSVSAEIKGDEFLATVREFANEPKGTDR